MTKICDESQGGYPRYYVSTPQSLSRACRAGVSSGTHYRVRKPGLRPDSLSLAWHFMNPSMVYSSEKQLLEDRYQQVFSFKVRDDSTE